MASATQNLNEAPGPLPRFTGEVAGVIRAAAEASRATPPGDGMERGGLLLAVTDGTDLKIDRVEMVNCEHRYGSEYRLSPDDVSALRGKADEVRSSGLRRIIGHVRTSSRDPLGFSLDENTVIREAVPECDWFVVARTLPDGSSRVRAFRYTSSGWNQAADFALQENADALAFAPEKPPPPLFRAATTGIGWLLNIPPLITGALALIAVAVVLWISFMHRPAPLPPNLGMRLGNDGNLLGVSWDTRPVFGSSARSGVLRIEDGGQQREVALDAGKVADGLILYRPQSADVTFQLEVRGNGAQALEETVRWMGRPDQLATAGFTVSPQTAPVASAPQPAANELVQATHPSTPVPAEAGAQPPHRTSSEAGEGLARFVVKTPGAHVTVQRADDPHAPEQPVHGPSLRLPAGTWIVRATAPGYRPFSRHFLVNRAGPADILIRLQPNHGA